MATRIQQRRDTAANWASLNPVLYAGEPGYVTDTGTFKIGDGSTYWNRLASWSITEGIKKLVSIGDLGFGSSLLANAASTAGTSEMMFTVGASASNVSLSWEHWYTQNASQPVTDVDPSGPITFSASLQVLSSTNPATVTGQLYRLPFNGRTTVTVDPGGRVTSDILGLSLAVGDVVAVRTYLSSGTAYAPRQTLGATSGCYGGFTAASDLTAPGSAAITGSTGYYYGPSALLGYADGAATAKSVVVLGDSIGRGLGDGGAVFTVPAQAQGGFVLRALSGAAGLLNLSIGGDVAAYFQSTNGSFRRLSNATYANTAIIEYGINDITIGNTAAATEAVILNLANNVRRLGISKVFVTTLTPKTTSTDNWATTTNQTPYSYEPQRVAYNTWVRANCPIDPTSKAPVAVGTSGALLAGDAGHPLTGFFDTGATVESSLNSGLWLPANRVVTGSMTSGQNVLTSSTANFQSTNQEAGGDKGLYCFLSGAGASGTALGFNLATIVSTTQANVNFNASTTVSNTTLVIGARTVDGTHPSPHGHYLMSQAVSPAVL